MESCVSKPEQAEQNQKGGEEIYEADNVNIKFYDEERRNPGPKLTSYFIIIFSKKRSLC
jgi:hypothetical protein